MSAAGREGFHILRLEALPGGRASAEVVLPEDSPLFAGHFPGQPVLPGIAHLALVQTVLGELAGAGRGATETAIVEVRHLRLRRTVAPGDRLELEVEFKGDDGLVHFALRQAAGELVSQGMVRCGAPGRPKPAGSREAAPRGATAAAAGLPSPARLLPHAAPARLITEVLSADAGGIECTASVPAEHPLVEGGGVPGFAALELGAQAAGALQALLRPGSDPGTPRIGYLVGARAASFAPVLPIGRTLRVTARPSGNAAPLAIYQIEVWAEEADGGILAAGILSTFILGA